MTICWAYAAIVPLSGWSWSSGSPSGINGVGGHEQLGSGQVLMTGKGGGIFKGIRRELERQLELDRHRMAPVSLFGSLLVSRVVGNRQPVARSLISETEYVYLNSRPV
jgi:hypothetical protein